MTGCGIGVLRRGIGRFVLLLMGFLVSDSHVFADVAPGVCLCGEPADAAVHVQGAGADLLRVRCAAARLYRQGVASYAAPHASLMVGLLAAGSTGPAVLARREQVSKPTITNSVSFLVRHGHAVRTDGGVDKRLAKVAPTPMGVRGVVQVLGLMEERAELLSARQRAVLAEAVELIELLAEDEPTFRLHSALDRFALPG